MQTMENGSSGHYGVNMEKDYVGVNIFARVRPQNKLEISKRSKNCLNVVNENKGISFFSPTRKGDHRYEFDKVFDEEADYSSIFKSVVEPMASRVMKGYNCAIISLGAKGSGKTRSMIGNGALKSTDEDTQDGVESYEEGIIPSATRELFELMANSSSELEFVVKVSFIQIHREEIFDLLDPKNRFLRIKENQCEVDPFDGNFPSIEGLSEYCCIRASDVITLLNRGYTNQLIQEEKYQSSTNSCHTMFTIKIEMKNVVTESVTKSSLVFPNLFTGDSKVKQDGYLRKILQSLDDYWKTNHRMPTESHMKYMNFEGSKLTKLLKNALIGNCYTTYLVHISSASTSADSTFNSLNFAGMLQKLRTSPKKNVQFSRKGYEEQLKKANLNQLEYMQLLNEIKTEFTKIKDESDDELLNGSVWERLDAFCEKHHSLLEEKKTSIETIQVAAMHTGQNMDGNIKGKLHLLTKERDEARRDNLKLKEECSFLNMQCEDLLKAKANHTEEISNTRNELHKLAQKNLEMEYNLRTSRFREQESVLFLRHFFRFYRRLLKNVNAQGSGDLKSVLAQIEAVPDLSDMNEIADMMVESGLIESFEIDSDIPRTGVYKPSQDALLRSSKEAHNNVQKNSDLNQYQNHQSAPNSFDKSRKERVSREQDSILEGLRSPGMRYTDKRVGELENEILVMTNRIIEQQKHITTLESQLEELTSKQKKKVSKKQQQIHEKTIADLKTELTKKSADLEGVIWKMNEIHLINKSYKDKLESRDQHIVYLDETLKKEFDKNYNQVILNAKQEKKLQTEVADLHKRMESLVKSLGKDGDGDTDLANRIVIPIQGGVKKLTVDPSIDLLHQSKNKTAVRIKPPEIKSSRKDTKRSLGGDSQSTLGARPTREILVKSEEENGDEITLPEFPIEEEFEGKVEKHIPVFLFAGGKPFDHQPTVFTNKKGRAIKSATLKDHRDEDHTKRQ